MQNDASRSHCTHCDQYTTSIISLLTPVFRLFLNFSAVNERLDEAVVHLPPCAANTDVLHDLLQITQVLGTRLGICERCALLAIWISLDVEGALFHLECLTCSLIAVPPEWK